jgi:ketosteroid isomerase-like protein
MSGESTTPDLMKAMRSRVDAVGSGDFDAMTSFFVSDAVWDSSPMGMEVYQGRAAIRRFFEDWWRGYEVSGAEAEELLDLGNDVTFAVLTLKGRPVGSGGEVHLRYAAVTEWVGGLVVRDTNYTDIDEARAAAERLAKERGG